jgi:hypothetical protein
MYRHVSGFNFVAYYFEALPLIMPLNLTGGS